MAPTRYADVSSCVDDIVDRLGPHITVGTPLGIGKANHILNELVERAQGDPSLELEIWTALSLNAPGWDSDLERRLVEPLADRLFGEYPGLAYDELVEEENLPPNIDVNEFYFQPGDYMANPRAQQNYHSVNFTHALRTFLDAEPDLILQLVGTGELDGEEQFNLSSNTDLSVDLIETLVEARENDGRDVMIVGEVNRNLPFMYGNAPVAADTFDAVLDDPAYDFPLFGPPKEPVSLVDHAIGLRVSTLIPDGGTLQIGIGSLGDSIATALVTRHQDNDTYRDLIGALDGFDDTSALTDELGGLDPFDEGLYGATEMFVEGFLHLFEEGILSREVFNDPDIQRLVDEQSLADGPTLPALDALVEQGAIEEELTGADVDYLKTWGLLCEAVAYDEGRLRIDGETIPADLGDETARTAIATHALGESLDGGRVLDGGFFLGSADFYEALREMDAARRRKMNMRSVLFTNALYRNEELKRRHRSDARFVNTGMKVTLTGGIVSDGTADGRVVSGVGGQFNFVNQAHELDDGRSIIMIRSTRGSGESVQSNVVWNYGHMTIPRHLRDIVVTEYGIADLYGKSDAEIVGGLIKIADSRFQADLMAEAKAAGKLPSDWSVPEGYRNNYPWRLEEQLGPFADDLEQFPFGTRLTDEEVALGGALRSLQAKMQNREFRGLLGLQNIRQSVSVPQAAEPYLERMDLDSPSTVRERLYRRLVVLALADNGAI